MSFIRIGVIIICLTVFVYNLLHINFSQLNAKENFPGYLGMVSSLCIILLLIAFFKLDSLKKEIKKTKNKHSND